MSGNQTQPAAGGKAAGQSAATIAAAAAVFIGLAAVKLYKQNDRNWQDALREAEQAVQEAESVSRQVPEIHEQIDEFSSLVQLARLKKNSVGLRSLRDRTSEIRNAIANALRVRRETHSELDEWGGRKNTVVDFGERLWLVCSYGDLMDGIEIQRSPYWFLTAVEPVFPKQARPFVRFPNGFVCYLTTDLYECYSTADVRAVFREKGIKQTQVEIRPGRGFVFLGEE